MIVPIGEHPVLPIHKQNLHQWSIVIFHGEDKTWFKAKAFLDGFNARIFQVKDDALREAGINKKEDIGSGVSNGN